MCKGKLKYRQNMRYQTSTNYELLYDLVIQGNEIPCWVYDSISGMIATVKYIKDTKKIVCESLFCSYFTIWEFKEGDVLKELFIRECRENDLEWLLPINAEFRNDKGELEYQIALIPNISKHSVEYCPILIDFTLSNRQFYYVPFGDIKGMISVSYHNYGKFLEHLSVIKAYTTEQALAVGLEMVKKIKEQNNNE